MFEVATIAGTVDDRLNQLRKRAAAPRSNDARNTIRPRC